MSQGAGVGLKRRDREMGGGEEEGEEERGGRGRRRIYREKRGTQGDDSVGKGTCYPAQ